MSWWALWCTQDRHLPAITTLSSRRRGVCAPFNCNHHHFLPSSPSFNTSLSPPFYCPSLLPLFFPILPPFHCPSLLPSHLLTFSIPLHPLPRAPPSSVIPEEEVLESNSGQWLRFNDILVDEFAMNDPAMEAECFGGSYKAKPNDRELLP